MIGNYFVIALRNLIRHKLYSFINIAGLAIGLACVILVILFVVDELSYDKWIPDTENLYQVQATIRPPGLPPMAAAITPFPLAEFMKDHLPEVMAMTRLFVQRMTVNVGDLQFPEIVDEVDSNFFQVIKLPLVEGDPASILADPQSAVVSESVARKYFGNTDPIGKTIGISRASCGPEMVACTVREPLRVTGVMRDLPHNTQLIADILIPQTSLVDRITQKGKEAWFNLITFSYVRLLPGATPDVVLAKLNPLLDQYVDLKKETGTDLSATRIIQTRMIPFTSVHLATAGMMAGASMTTPGSWTTIYGLGIIGTLILLIACFNFMNLATARATLRAREIALRKCVGASRGQLIVQFLGESVLMSLMALLFAFAIAEVVLPAVGPFLGHPLAFHYVRDWYLLVLMLVLGIFSGVMSGSYPALVLSKFRPATVLKANDKSQNSSGSLRQVLVVLQFAVSIGLSIVAFVVFAQINYARHVEMGFRRDNIVTINAFRRLTPSQMESFANVLRSNPGVTQVAMSGDVPLIGYFNFDQGQLPGQQGTINLEAHMITPDFPMLYGIRLVAGRMLSDTRGEDVVIHKTDSSNEGHNILINEAAAARFGYTPREAIGKTLILEKNQVRIVGVLGDAKINGVRQAVRPSVYLYDRQYPSYVSVLMRPGMVSSTMTFIDTTWRHFAPTVAITRSFVSDDFDKMYQSDETQGEVFGIFVGIAIFIACLGLFGLAAFTVGRRTKEIGIRKIFGARSGDVVFLLLWQFSIPVLIANAIAWPIAWYYLHSWLLGFAYRISLSPFYFLGAGAVALIIAWATIFAHTLSVARANPVQALRYE
jgi:putative ABC transport system permease protein